MFLYSCQATTMKMLTLIRLLILCWFTTLIVTSRAEDCFGSSEFGDNIAKEGYAECPTGRQFLYLKGLELSGTDDNLKDIKRGRCCQPDVFHLDWPYTCHSADWGLSFKREGWATCAPGFFLRGFHRGASDELKSIDWASCCKPALQPYWYRECYDQAVGQGTRWQCNRDGFVMVGMYRGADEKLSSITQIRCCNMNAEARPLTSLDQAKSRIMDVTLTNLALLAHAMGYGWTGGCRSRWPGMDYRREGDTWKSNYQEPCEGFKKENRLKITYENFSFKVKNMEYGRPVTDNLKPIVQDVGEIKNKDSLSSETTIRREIRTVRTVIHSSTSRWKSGIGASVSLKYTSPGAAGAAAGSFSASITLSGESESGQVDTNENGETNWETLRAIESQKINGLSGATYRLNVARKNVTVPYKATIQVQFSTKLEGFLRYGGGKGGDSPNFHEEHHGSDSRPDFAFTMGSAEEPFFKALKRQSQRGDSPWLWNDMRQKYEWLADVVTALTTERLYEFTLEGKFYDVSGLNFDVKWADVPL